MDGTALGFGLSNFIGFDPQSGGDSRQRIIND
jgi:hypothetical protein